MNKMNRFKKLGVTALGVTLACSMMLPVLTGCDPDNNKKNDKDSIVIMTEEVPGLFNPFYATSGTDQDVVGMTQIGMLSIEYDESSQDKVKVVAGDDQPTVVKAFDVNTSNSAETVYTFVIKNGLKFSDGKPLTMNDVMFNIYEYLDPVYTGSSTMYSTDIVGLSQYRTQKNYSGGGDEAETQLSQTATAYAKMRINELIDCYEMNFATSASNSSYYATDAQMREAIANWEVTDGFKGAVATEKEQATFDFNKQLLADYDFALETFKKELESDYAAAKDSFDVTTAPYKDWANKLENELFKFFLYEGYIKPVYAKVLGKDDLTKIEKFEGEEILNVIKDKTAAINRVFKDKTESELNYILSFWATASTLTTQFIGAARDVLLHNNMEGDELLYPNIEGIVSLGHTGSTSSVTIGGTTYNVATSHNADGTPTNANEYDVLQIRVNGVDPKAIYNFSFTVAPAHYYGSDDNGTVAQAIDIKNNKFGVVYADSDFQSKIVQCTKNVEVPMGAGTFKATNAANDDTTTGAQFMSGNVIYYKANDNFMFEVKAKKLRYQVVSSTNAIDTLASGDVDFITPQFTLSNADRLEALKSEGIETLSAWQLGYGYIGVNAGKVPNVYVRRAIMSAMQTSLSLEYYKTGTCKNIDWPMSSVSWAYPFEDDGVTSASNGHDYMMWTNEAAARDKVQKYMDLAGVSEGSSELTIEFTIAGSSITEHPTYAVFKQAAEILNSMGWKVNVKADAQALTKLSTGSLAVWAAAWGSTVDPDMYQVYHKNSSATSVYSWGYREILTNQSLYGYEYGVIDNLSELIDDGRATLDQNARKSIYKEAMSYVLDLAVEMPVYQRMNLYAYNKDTITGLKTTVNPYSNPLEEIWNLELTA